MHYSFVNNSLFRLAYLVIAAFIERLNAYFV